MDRRDFLKAGAGAALLSGTSTQTGCATAAQGLPLPVAPLPDMAATLAKLDRDLARIDQQLVCRHFAPLAKPSLMHRELAPNEALLRGSVKALYLSGAFRDLSQEAQLHPGVQARLWAAAPELDETVLGMRAQLTTISDADLNSVRDAMRKDPLLLPRVVECLDAASAEAEIQPERRLKMRSLMKTLGWRMQHQSPRAVIDEYTDKMRRVEARDGSLAEQERRIAAHMTEEAFFAYRERLERIAVRWQEQGAGAGGDGSARRDFKKEGLTYVGPGSTVLSVGLNMMGWGLLTFAGGWALVGIGAGLGAEGLGYVGFGVTTLGGVSMIIGLLVTIIGAVIRSLNSDDPANWAPEEPRALDGSTPVAKPRFLVDERWAKAWVERNRLQLPQDLALGRGPAITELAQATGLSPANHDRLGALLREYQRELLGLVEGPSTGPRAVEFFNVVGDTISGDPVLAAEFDAAMARLQKR